MPTYVINVDAADKTSSAVVSATDRTPVTSLEQLVLGDTPLFTITFCDDDGNAPSWAGQAGYTLTTALGIPDVRGQAAKTTSSAYTPITAGWSGYMTLNTTQMIDALALAVGNAVEWSRYPTATRVPSALPRVGYFVLQIRVTDPSGNEDTYAVLRVAVVNRVAPQAAGTSPSETAAFYAWIQANTVLNAHLVGIASNVADPTLLCGLNTANGEMPAYAKLLVSFPANLQVLFELVPITTTSLGFLFAPWDYHATSNPYKWRLRAVWTLGEPCFYNNDTALWHYGVAVGAANAVYFSLDQTGVALPA